jgi:ABC-type multidrug transport system ATPase subunit
VQPPVLEIRRLARRFGTHEVLNDLSLKLEAGQRLALRGPNGSGKTTLLRCVLGTQEPSEGEVLIAGLAAGTMPARRLIGATFSHERSFYLRLTGRENLRFYAAMRHRDRRVAEAELSVLTEELRLGRILAERLDRCSTGMVQQLAFARALIGSPALLLLDEPTKSLDADAVVRLWDALDRRPDVAVVIATHRDDDVARCHGERVLSA